MNFILGGGINGFISLYYNKDYNLITKEWGQDSHKLGKGPRILKKTKFVENFLNEINYKKGSRIYKCEYWNKRIYFDKEKRKELQEMYLKKTRGENWDDFSKTGMNDSLLEIEGYELLEIYEFLRDFSLKNYSERISFLNVNSLNLNEKLIFGIGGDLKPYILEYDKIISTVNFIDFFKLIKNDNDLKIKTSPIYFYYGIVKSFYENLIEGYDFIYFPGEESFYRLSRTTNEEIFCLESLKRLQIEEINEVFENGTLLVTEEVLNNSKIIDRRVNLEEFSGRGISFIGRYANNDNSLRVHNVIEFFQKENK